MVTIDSKSDLPLMRKKNFIVSREAVFSETGRKVVPHDSKSDLPLAQLTLHIRENI